MTMNSPTKTLDVGLGDIAVSPERLRALRPDRVAEIAESMQANGLLQPIVLRTGEGNAFWLVAGRHRFEAAKLLKWDSIRATIYEGMDSDRAELAEIDENLIRAELSPIERARTSRGARCCTWRITQKRSMAARREKPAAARRRKMQKLHLSSMTRQPRPARPGAPSHSMPNVAPSTASKTRSGRRSTRVTRSTR